MQERQVTEVMKNALDELRRAIVDMFAHKVVAHPLVRGVGLRVMLECVQKYPGDKLAGGDPLDPVFDDLDFVVNGIELGDYIDAFFQEKLKRLGDLFDAVHVRAQHYLKQDIKAFPLLNPNKRIN